MTDSTQPTAPPSIPTPDGSNRALTIVLTAVAYFMVTLDALVVVTALPSIHRQLGGGIGTLQWTAHMERPGATKPEAASYRAKFEGLAATRQSLRSDSEIATVDLLAMTLALIGGWFSASPALHELGPAPAWSPERLDGYRAAMHAAVSAISAL